MLPERDDSFDDMYDAGEGQREVSLHDSESGSGLCALASNGVQPGGGQRNQKTGPVKCGQKKMWSLKAGGTVKEKRYTAGKHSEN